MTAPSSARASSTTAKGTAWCRHARGPTRKTTRPGCSKKSGAVVRRLVGFGRLGGGAATTALARLYASSRPYINFFQPSFKLTSKTRGGARVRKVSFTPATLCDRLLAHSSISPAITEKLKAQFMRPEPVRLLQEIRHIQQTLSAIAAHGLCGAVVADIPAIADFVASLTSASKEKEARPIHRKQPTAKHG